MNANTHTHTGYACYVDVDDGRKVIERVKEEQMRL